jgi:hypothetical protein
MTVVNTNEISLPGGPLISLDAEIIQAVTTKKQGFKNSEGCKEANPKVYQRVAPFPKSVPKIGSNMRAINEKTKPITANLLTKSTDIIDNEIIVTIDSEPKITCLST